MKKLLLLTIILCSLSSCKETATKEKQPTTVRTAKAIETPKETTRSYTFISRPYRVTELSFRVGGPVKTFDVQNGQFFRKGELIASIDDRDYIIRQKRTATTLAQAESEYRRISALYERDNISAASFKRHWRTMRKPGPIMTMPQTRLTTQRYTPHSTDMYSRLI